MLMEHVWGLVAKIVKDAIWTLVMPFVEANILKPSLHYREVATYAFGSILEGSTFEKFFLLVHTSLEILLVAIKVFLLK